MTREEFKTILASKANKLAGKAIDLINACGTVEELKKLVDAGAPDVFYARSPSKPRSAFTFNHVIDACFQTDIEAYDVVRDEDKTTITIGPVHRSKGREKLFEYLLTKDFKPGTTNYRGGLFHHIVRACFYTTMREQARVFTRILKESGRYDFDNFLRHDYGWHTVDGLEFIQSLGLDPTMSGALDCVLNYYGGDDNGVPAELGRPEVVRRLLRRGATATESLSRVVSWQSVRYNLEKDGFLPTFIKMGVISAEPGEGYERWLKYKQEEGCAV